MYIKHRFSSCYQRDIRAERTEDVLDISFDYPVLYFATCNYTDRYSNQKFTLFAYRILKTTEHYYMLQGGRVHKHLKSKNNFALTPEEALQLAAKRARIYLSSTMDRCESIIRFLNALDDSASNLNYKHKLKQFEQLFKLDREAAESVEFEDLL